MRLVARVQEDRVRAPPARLLRAEDFEPREHRIGRARRRGEREQSDAHIAAAAQARRRKRGRETSCRG